MGTLAVVALLLLGPGNVQSGEGDVKDACDKACQHRIRVHKKHHRQWHWIKTHPMPRCTWWGESGVGRPEYSMLRYREWNRAGSSAGGKYQILNSTWYSNGGSTFGHRFYRPAQHATPYEQEHVARRVLRHGGLSQWALC